MQLEYAAIGNGSVQVGNWQVMSVTERLLPGETAPMLERSRYAIGSERFTCWKLAAFGRRLIVEVIRRDR
jgi:hypothetical protein